MPNDNKRPVSRPPNARQGAPNGARQTAPPTNAAKNTALSAGKSAQQTSGGEKPPKKGLSTTQVFMIALAGTLLAVGGLWMLVLSHEGDLAQARAEAALRSFELSELEPLSSLDHQMAASLGALPSALEPYVAPERPQYETERDIERAMKTHTDYKAIAKLTIEKLELTLPILEECTTQALKISICKFQGPEPMQPGNLVITGHNYKNGAHFGRLDELVLDDVVIITDANDDFRRYFVYEILVVQPDDLAALDTGKNANALTLVTCAEEGTMRLLVKCRAI